MIVVEVLVDGTKIADTAASFDAGDTVVLTDLDVDWGRTTPVDQPGADSCSVVLGSKGGWPAVITALSAGQTVDVTATGVVPPTPGSLMVDPGFESAAVGSTPGNVKATGGTATVVSSPVHTGARALQLAAASSGSVLVGPAPFSTTADAWDDIPTTTVGEAWTIGASVRLLPGATGTVQAAIFDDPTGTSYTTAGAAAAVTGDGTWKTVTAVVSNAAAGKWVGLIISGSKLAPPWNVMPDTWANTAGKWTDWTGGMWVDDLVVEGPGSGFARTVLVFHGRITDAEGSIVRTPTMLRIETTSRSFPADLQNTRIGDDPWPVQALGDRVDRILQLTNSGVTAEVDDSIASTLVTYRDVDSQPAAGLIEELAASVAGVAWSAAHRTRGGYYWIEDPGQRQNLYYLEENSAGVVVIASRESLEEAIIVGADKILVDPLRWVQDVSAIGTRVDVTWLEQTVDESGKPAPTERHSVVIDPALEAKHGRRGISLQSQLQSQADAIAVGTRLLNRVARLGWRLEGVEWQQSFDRGRLTDQETRSTLNLLDGTRRIGHAMQITGIADYFPLPATVNAYLEGGTYTYEAYQDPDTGRWKAAWDLKVQLSYDTGAGTSATWQQLDPTWRWVDFDPAITWNDLIGVGV